MGHSDGVHWHNNDRSRCQNLRLPYFFLISELNTCPILMFKYSFQSLGPPLQESELTGGPLRHLKMAKTCPEIAVTGNFRTSFGHFIVL